MCSKFVGILGLFFFFIRLVRRHHRHRVSRSSKPERMKMVGAFFSSFARVRESIEFSRIPYVTQMIIYISEYRALIQNKLVAGGQKLLINGRFGLAVLVSTTTMPC
jgi:hypothetical protein